MFWDCGRVGYILGKAAESAFREKNQSSRSCWGYLYIFSLLSVYCSYFLCS